MDALSGFPEAEAADDAQKKAHTDYKLLLQRGKDKAEQILDQIQKQFEDEQGKVDKSERQAMKEAKEEQARQTKEGVVRAFVALDGRSLHRSFPEQARLEWWLTRVGLGVAVIGGLWFMIAAKRCRG
jgi:hypothetical protein